VVDLKSRFEPYEFNFDWVLPDTSSQSDVFEGRGLCSCLVYMISVLKPSCPINKQIKCLILLRFAFIRFR
jgi:hypothetical protein